MDWGLSEYLVRSRGLFEFVVTIETHFSSDVTTLRSLLLP